MKNDTIYLKFRATESKPVYVGNFKMEDGDVKGVSKAEAKRLLTDYPDNFELLRLKSWRAYFNKMMKPERDK